MIWGIHLRLEMDYAEAQLQAGSNGASIPIAAVIDHRRFTLPAGINLHAFAILAQPDHSYASNPSALDAAVPIGYACLKKSSYHPLTFSLLASCSPYAVNLILNCLQSCSSCCACSCEMLNVVSQLVSMTLLLREG